MIIFNLVMIKVRTIIIIRIKVIPVNIIGKIISIIVIIAITINTIMIIAITSISSCHATYNCFDRIVVTTYPKIVHVATEEDLRQLEQLVLLVLHVNIKVEFEVPAWFTRTPRMSLVG